MDLLTCKVKELYTIIHIPCLRRLDFQEQCLQKGLFNEGWKQYVGILQDEIKMKDDLVYCPTTGELIGYVNLDETSDQIKELKDGISNTPPELATCALVGGPTLGLCFPLAAFALHSLDAKPLYTLLWQVIDLLPSFLFLKNEGHGATLNLREDRKAKNKNKKTKIKTFFPNKNDGKVSTSC